MEIVLILAIGVVLGIFVSKYLAGGSEGFTDVSGCSTPGGKPSTPICDSCKKDWGTCSCPGGSGGSGSGSGSRPVCPPCAPCREPDLSKYVLKASVPPCPALPDLSNYILKSEVPPVPDMSKYVLKSSIPRQAPVILDCSKCNKPKGDCPACPRPRCPEVKCPPAPSCPPAPKCAPCPVTPAPKIKCVADESAAQSSVRPYLAPLSFPGFGQT